MYLSGRKAAQVSGNILYFDPISPGATYDIKLDSLFVDDAKGIGIYFGIQAGWASIITNCIVEHCVNGFMAEHSDDVRIINNKFIYNVRGMYIHGVDSINMLGNFIYSNSYNGLEIVSSTTRLTVVGNTFWGNSDAAANTYNDILLTDCDNSVFSSNIFFGAQQKYAVEITSGSTGNILTDNQFLGVYGTGFVLNSDATTKISNNRGYVTESSGSATLVQGTTSIAVTHGLATTPTRVQITATSNPYGKYWWISAKGATTFTITTDSVIGAQAVLKAYAGDAAVYTDETAAANSAGANDMTLLPATPAANDTYYFGHANPFRKIEVNIGTQGVGVWTVTWEYWNGAAWTALAGVTDNTVGFTAAAGNRVVTWTLPTNWASKANSPPAATTAYWIRARVSAYTSVVTAPIGTQAWIYPDLIIDWRAVVGEGN